MDISISIIICTYNRAVILADTLESYATLIRPAESNIELIVVDNNSNDNTQKISEQFIERHPETRYIFEQKSGLSNARNTGIKESLGEIIAFVDDDVYFNTLWLIELLKAFKNHPEASCMGGQSIPKFEGGKPEWVTDQLLSCYGSTNSGEIQKWMEYPEHPFGLNMAFKREVFAQIGMFNPNLGRKNKNLLSNEESELFGRIHKSELKVIYCPTAILYHRIPKSRINKQWLLSRYYWQGISAVVTEQIVSPKNKYQLAAQLKKDIKTLLHEVIGNNINLRKIYWRMKKIGFVEQCNYYYLLGRIKQTFSNLLSSNFNG